MIIKSLAEVPFDDLFNVWNEAFTGYARTWTKQELQSDMQRRGYQPDRSFGAFDGDKLVSFILNATGQFNNVATAYDAGTGTIPEYRGRKLVTQIFDHSLPHLKAAGCKQYLLEVLQSNDKAIKLYKHAGFIVSRELNYFVHPIADVNLSKTRRDSYMLKEIAAEEQPGMRYMWSYHPSWQNSFDSIHRGVGYKAVGAYSGDMLIGYGIIATASGDVAQLVVAGAYRRQGVATALLKALLELSSGDVVKFINTDKACIAFTSFLAAHNMPVSGAQYEMLKKLDG